MHKKRNRKRVHLVYYLLVFDGHTDKLAGNLVDITPEGMKLMSNTPHPLDTSYQLRVELPPEVAGNGKQISVNAKCVWCQEKLYSNSFGAGFQFEEISPENVERINNLINNYGY